MCVLISITAATGLGAGELITSLGLHLAPRERSQEQRADGQTALCVCVCLNRRADSTQLNWIQFGLAMRALAGLRVRINWTGSGHEFCRLISDLFGPLAAALRREAARIETPRAISPSRSRRRELASGRR